MFDLVETLKLIRLLRYSMSTNQLNINMFSLIIYFIYKEGKIVGEGSLSFYVELNKLYKILTISFMLLMITLCSITGTCIENTDLSVGAIIGIIIGGLTGLAAFISIIICISIFCTKKQRPSVVFIQNPDYHTTTGYNPSMNMNYYPAYIHSIPIEEPPPVYQSQNTIEITNEKIET